MSYGSYGGGGGYGSPMGGGGVTKPALNTVTPQGPDSPSGLEITGMTGRFDMINAVYEPMAQPKNGRPCWCARAMQSTYIFHTGKARWVISRRLDEGARCYAFLKDTGAGLPYEEQTQNWMIPAGGGEWQTSTSMNCNAVPTSNDKFVQLRMSVDDELVSLGLTNIQALRQLWKRLDYNGNNIVSLAEIDKMVVELTNNGVWPAWLNNKPALMRAYKKTCLKDGDGDDWVEKKEFHALLLNIFWMNKIYLIFDAMDGDDRRMNAQEFMQGMSRLGLQLSPEDAQKEFAKMDKNGGGQVLFVEFCAYIRQRVNPDCHPYLDADIYSGTHCGRTPPPPRHHSASRELNFSQTATQSYEKPSNDTMRRSLGHKGTHTHMLTQKSLGQFQKVEDDFRSMCKDPKFTKLRELWHRADFNGNNILSLAEIDKLAVENYPILNHKPALMRAYKATISSGNGDDWVQKKEFKQLLANLIYFNKLFWLFEEADTNDTKYGDRRLDIKDFTWMMNNLGVRMHPTEIHSEFAKVDRNGGGQILFDEFCVYVSQKKCPEAMSELLD